ncbi:DUF4157 domain-containing protein [Archangium minus]|uniref:DUF4157 domain-containing protein n=1 Tax=Archangium minus TaxID=83450 RepID=A0ABY9WST0_9BACT|nr:DUF4157 domain-containing protein [Archangium minus]
MHTWLSCLCTSMPIYNYRRHATAGRRVSVRVLVQREDRRQPSSDSARSNAPALRPGHRPGAATSHRPGHDFNSTQILPADSDTGEVGGRVESEVRALQGGGSPLPDAARSFFEARFRHDFSAVRIHADARAARLARGVGARAFTLGRDVMVGAGEYAPETLEGRRLLAHELAHVVQQERAGPHVQCLAIKQAGRSWGDCGQYSVSWAFVLDHAAPDDGYIVQQVDRNEWIGECPAQGTPAPLPTYWEAWFVKKGYRKSVDTIGEGRTDTSALFTPMPNTAGMLRSVGTIKFFTAGTTGDLMTAWTEREPGWGCLFPRVGKVPEAGGLPSTDIQPSWWNNTPVEGPKTREVNVSWNCCDPDEAKHKTEVSATP